MSGGFFTSAVPDEGRKPPDIDTSVAHQARVHDYLPGGKDHFAADREVGEEIPKVYPDSVVGTRGNRAFLGRAVRFLAGEAGIRQFLDIGTGIPSANNTHEVAQGVALDSRIVYVDNDPIVLVHARALLADPGVEVISGDLRHPTGHASMLTMSQNDWFSWHSPYDDPGSALSRRLAMVQARLAEALDRCRPGRVQVISMCAGQGHDILGVLARHPRADDIAARLVESDPRNTAVTRQGAAPFAGVEVAEADAGCTDAYAGAVPADIVLACGVFGNISGDHVHRTVAALPRLCAPGAAVIWTRHRLEPDLTPRVRDWFCSAGFAEEAFDVSDDTLMAVGSHRLTGEALPFQGGQYLFGFNGQQAATPGDPSGAERS
jgi:hypothetical protein